MTRRALVIAALLLLSFTGGWLLFFALPRWYSPKVQTTPAAPTAPATGAPTATRKITATLYYVTDDGMALTPVRREVPFGATPADQARAIIEAQIAPAAPLVSAIPPETKLRDVYVTDRGDAFVDLSAEVSTKHPGGSLEEIFTVYTPGAAFALPRPPPHMTMCGGMVN